MKQIKKKGFTMIEGLVAITILVMIITVAFNLIQGGFKPITYSRSQTTAGFLAQEAIETVRFIRDINLSEGYDWLDGFEDCLSGFCQVSVFDSNMISNCGGEACGNLRQEESTGRYGYDLAWRESPFIREVAITEESGYKATVSVTVRWPEGEVSIAETLYNFR